jgi:hypothetical protein
MPSSPLAPRVAARHRQRIAGDEPLEDGDPERDARLLQRRLERIADRGRELLQRAKGEPTFSHEQMLKGIALMVAEAERDA